MGHDRRSRPIVDVPPTTAAPPTSSVLTSSFPTSVVAPLTAADPSTSMAHDRWSHPIVDAPPTTAAPPTSTVPNSSRPRNQESFDIDISLPHIRKCCDDIIASIFRRFRSDCHQHFTSFRSIKEAEEQPPKKLVDRVDDWKWMCRRFNSDRYKNEMIEMQAASVEGECYLTSDDIATKVLGIGPSYYRGLGYRPRPPSSKSKSDQGIETVATMQQELEKHKSQLEVAHKLIAVLQEENKAIRANQEEFQSKMAAFFTQKMFSCSGSETQDTPF